jgi:hypothetical protein
MRCPSSAKRYEIIRIRDLTKNSWLFTLAGHVLTCFLSLMVFIIAQGAEVRVNLFEQR